MQQHQDVTLVYIGLAAIAAVSFVALGYLLRKIHSKNKLKNAEDSARKMVDTAKTEADKIRHTAELQAKDQLLKLRSEFEKETKDRRQELVILEKRLLQKEENLDRKLDSIDRKEKDVERRNFAIAEKEKGVALKEKDLERLFREEQEKLQNISGMTRDEAKRLLLAKLEDEVKQEAAILIKRTEDEAKEKADKEARKIIGLAIQRCAADHAVETTVSVVNLPSDEMKGRIIGREGRNIRALEIATGIDVIIDDTPGAVILSGFDPVKREIARLSLERLLHDGRIHPGRIEEVVEKVKKEMENTMREEGEKALFDTGLHGLHPELIKLLGKLKYRTSYGQNVLEHSKEVAHLMGVMASELKLDFNLAKRIGLLHDIGKAVSHEVEGTHSKLGADLARKYGESENICHAIEAHHQDIEPKTLLAVLCQAGDAISASRPGARRETLETYVKRLEKLESIADSFKGVEKAYAIQAGREIRVIVQPEKISDAQAAVMARDITKKIEEGLEYPGQIKVTVVRETRAVEYAK
ncbi:MAG: ribonuclease Y [Candidatus Omnitrophica bacterium]|nr:ribonuclease Y [Candidatus Omnitrophota bacterium]